MIWVHLHEWQEANVCCRDHGIIPTQYTDSSSIVHDKITNCASNDQVIDVVSLSLGLLYRIHSSS